MSKYSVRSDAQRCIPLASLRSHHLFFRILTEIGNFDDSRLRFLATFDAPGNSYRTSSDARPIAIDYIMHKPGYGNVRRVIRILFPHFPNFGRKVARIGLASLPWQHCSGKFRNPASLLVQLYISATLRLKWMQHRN